MAAVEEGEVEHHEVAVGGEDGAHHGQDEAEGEDHAERARMDTDDITMAIWSSASATRK